MVPNHTKNTIQIHPIAYIYLEFIYMSLLQAVKNWMKTKSTSRGLGFSFQPAITAHRLSLICHSNAPSARTAEKHIYQDKPQSRNIMIMGLRAVCFLLIRTVRQHGAFTDQRSLGCNLRLYSCEYRKNRLVRLFLFLHVSSLILFYAVFKTATSIEDDKEVRKWSKYWIFYGIASFFCNLLNAGDLPMIIVCGILLFKFNVPLFVGS